MTTPKDVFEAWAEWNQQTFEAAKKLAELNLALSEKLIKEQSDLANNIVELTAKMLTHSAKPKTFRK